MTMKQLGKDFGQGGSGLTDGRLASAVRQLQGLTTVVVDGAAADTDIAVAGLGAEDHIQSVVMYASGVPSVLTPSAQSAGNVQFESETTGNKLVINFYAE